MKKYPLIEKLGLYILDKESAIGVVDVIHAEDLEVLLENATVVYGQKYFDSDNSKNGWRVGEDFSWQTHKALLIAIEPLEQKKVTITREDLKEAIKKTNSFSGNYANALAKELGL